jgi:FAD:protein FMN transferase
VLPGGGASRARRSDHHGRGARLDFDGIAKGWAVDSCVERLRAAGVSRALVSLGESSLYALGVLDGAAQCRLAVRGPDPETRVGWLGLRDAGASVSATFGSAGRRPGAVAHIIDPRCGRPLEDDAVASSATDVEGWTKALLIWGADGIARVRRGGAAAAVHVSSGAVRADVVHDAGAKVSWTPLPAPRRIAAREEPLR